MDLWHWLQHLTGADDGSGAWYSFWSGFGADVGEFALVGAAIGVYRKHRCHMEKCWRLAKQDVEGSSWKLCHKHHPEGRATPDGVARHHEVVLANRARQRAALEATAASAERERAAVSGHPAEEALVTVETDEARESEDIHPPST